MTVRPARRLVSSTCCASMMRSLSSVNITGSPARLSIFSTSHGTTSFADLLSRAPHALATAEGTLLAGPSSASGRSSAGCAVRPRGNL